MAVSWPERRIQVSVHDVMPETLPEVEPIVDLVRRAGLGPASLLVVPGRDWDSQAIGRLRHYTLAGHELVGHGWRHRARDIRGIRHRLHSVLLSRDAAEHLALGADEICELVMRCRRWFDRHDLPSPTLYVPPAWALGRVARTRLRGLGFRYFETLSGIFDSETGRTRRYPLQGFEADTAGRALLLRIANGLNGAFARRCGRLRIAIHPHDPQLRLTDDLSRRLVELGSQAARARPSPAGTALGPTGRI